MELPPYRMPTMKGLAIHTWERTWQYIKKAGTVILGISIIMWALMTYPGLSAEQEALWQSKIDAAQTAGEKADLHKRMAEAGLQASVAGYMGRGLEHITAPLGFDWRVNVALVGGFAAKEVIVSTMGTAYSLGEVEEGRPGQPEPASGRRARLEQTHGLCHDDIRDGLCSLPGYRGGNPQGNQVLEMGPFLHGLHHRIGLYPGIGGLPGRPCPGTGGVTMWETVIVLAVVVVAVVFVARRLWRESREGSCGCCDTCPGAAARH